MAGINQGTPEAAIGEPIRFGDDLDFEIEQHPISDRLIIRDTANGKEAYVRADRGGTIGGDGVLVRALREGKPVADDGRTHDTIQEAERAASSFVFVPPGTFNENVSIDTEGLTLRGSGYNTLIDGGARGNAIDWNEDNGLLTNISVSTTNNSNDNNNAVLMLANDGTIKNTAIRSADSGGISGNGDTTIVNCTVDNSFKAGIRGAGIAVGNKISNSGTVAGIRANDDSVIANNVVTGAITDGIGAIFGDNNIMIGNRIINSSNNGITVFNAENNIIANNRISDSVGLDIDNQGTGTLLDGNVTGASN